MAKFYVQMYDEYPIYEPAEGGYYYAGTTIRDTYDNEYDSLTAAIEDVRAWVDEMNADAWDDEVWTFVDIDAATVMQLLAWDILDDGVRNARVTIAYRNSKYIGEGARIYIETAASYRKGERGWHPYE